MKLRALARFVFDRILFGASREADAVLVVLHGGFAKRWPILRDSPLNFATHCPYSIRGADRPAVVEYSDVMTALLNASRDRAWTQLQAAVDELQEFLETQERTRYPARAGIDVFTISLRHDNLATAVKQLRDVQRRVNARHLESLREDLRDVIYLSRRIALNTEYFNAEFEQSLAILEVADAELVYEAPEIATPSPLILAVSDALITALAREPRLLYQVSPRRFEELVAELFRKQGFDVELTPISHDKGADIIAVSRLMNIPQKLIIECKRYAEHNHVGIDIVQRLLGVKHYAKANKGVLVTTSSFTRQAQSVARESFWDLDLKEYSDVVSWLREAASA